MKTPGSSPSIEGGSLRRMVVASRRILFLAGLPIIAGCWIILVEVALVMLVVTAAWLFLSGADDWGEFRMTERVMEAPDILWEKWARLLSHNT